MPILPHKIGNVRDFYDDMSEKFRSDTEDRFKAVGIKKALVFVQSMPQGDYIVEYVEGGENIDKTLQEMSGANIDYSRYIKDQHKDFSGIDLSDPKNAPRLELLYDWTDTHESLEEKDMVKMPWAFAVPVLPGKTDTTKKYWADSRGPRSKETEGHLHDLDVERLLVYLQHTHQGDFLVHYMVASNQLDLVMSKAASGNTPRSEYVRRTYKEVSGIDFANPESLDLELVFDWDDVNGFWTAEQLIAYTE